MKIWHKNYIEEKNITKDLYDLLKSVENQLEESRAVFNMSEDDELVAVMLLKDTYLTKYREYILSELMKLSKN